MRIKVNVIIDVDRPTAERLLEAAPKNLWKSLNLIANTRPDAMTVSTPTEVEEGAEDVTPTSP